MCVGWISRAMLAAFFTAGVCSWGPPTSAQDDFEREPINYSAATPDNVVSRLEARLRSGESDLEFEEHFGYLRAVLRELGVSHASQMLVFSKTSLQRQRIAPSTPRAVFFSDDVYVGFCQQGDVMELSAVDPRLGAVFYTLDQHPSARPRLVRQGDSCLICHASSSTQGVPGHVVRSVFSDPEGYPILSAGTYRIDHTSPLAQRWGGWYVTGTHRGAEHLGNLLIPEKEFSGKPDNAAGQNLTDLGDRFDRAKYLRPDSDLVALMVLEHQAQAQNFITKASFAGRQAIDAQQRLNAELGEPADHQWDSTASRIRGAGDPLVKYLLFAGEAPLAGRIEGTSTFTAEFAALGPRDSQGRSLRDFDLERRLFRYPCSYLIYSASFDSMPPEMSEYVLRRLHNVLTGQDTRPEFAHLSPDDRRAILEILRETKPNLPAYWRTEGTGGGE
jgi:hypothetical protein